MSAVHLTAQSLPASTTITVDGTPYLYSLIDAPNEAQTSVAYHTSTLPAGSISVVTTVTVGNQNFAESSFPLLVSAAKLLTRSG